MDTASGGVKRWGGYHRAYAGHSVSDVRNWRKYGYKFGVELGKDFLTRHGLPLPGVQTLARKKIISARMASRVGSMSIGKACETVLGVAGTASVAKRFATHRESLSEIDLAIGAVGKAFGAVTTQNPILGMAATADLCMASVVFVERQTRTETFHPGHIFTAD